MAIGDLAALLAQGVGQPQGMAVGGGVPVDPFSPQAIYGGLPYGTTTTTDLLDAMRLRGPYAGARGFLRGTGQPLALPRADLLSELGGATYGQGTTLGRIAYPSSIPVGAGAGTGAASLPYAPEAFAMGPAQIPNQGNLGAIGRIANPTAIPPNMGAMGQANSAVGLPYYEPPNAATALLESGVGPQTGNNLRAGLSNVGRGVSSELAGTVTPSAVAAGEGALARRGLMGTLRGMAPAAETGALSRIGASFRPGSFRGGLGRLGAGLAIGTIGGAAAERAGGASNPLGQFLEGASMGGSFGAAAGAPGAAVGALGVGIGNLGSHALLGRGIESITGSGEGEATGPFADYLKSQVVGQDDQGNDVYSDRAQIMAGLMDPEVNMFAQLGVPPEKAAEIQAQYASETENATQEQRVEALGRAADETINYLTELQTGAQMSPSDLAAMQIAATQLISPVAADQVALGNMQADALGAIQPSLPAAYQQPVQNMISQAVPQASRAANAYIQQAVALPQLNAVTQQQSAIDQTAQQLTAQALSNVTPGGGMGDLASLISGAGATGGAGGSSADIVAQMQQLGLG